MIRMRDHELAMLRRKHKEYQEYNCKTFPDYKGIKYQDWLEHQVIALVDELNLIKNRADAVLSRFERIKK